MTLAENTRDLTRNVIVDARLKRPEIDVSLILEPDGCFRAIDRNNYDVDCDHTGFFSRTPLDAIVDLLDNTAEN